MENCLIIFTVVFVSFTDVQSELFDMLDGIFGICYLTKEFDLFLHFTNFWAINC
jgi:hypothetical protein